MTASATLTARAMVASVLGDALTDGVPDDGVLRRYGAGSGDLIRLSLVLEETLDRPLDDDELATVQTIADIQRLLDASTAAGPT